MRDNVILWWVLTAFFAVVAVVYTGWNILEHQDRELVLAIEWVGTVALLFTAFMAAMIAWYLHRTHRNQGGELPEDILTSDIDDGDPELGEFSPWSWWPIVLAGSAAIFVIGLAVGQFLLPIGLAIFVVAIVGWVYEYYRGNFAR
ncbi:cytochrome c oxidase subunit 4 [Microbacterium sp. CIAB417]|uniref:cytochrome c oxidase subunit 4 n=1 Tax=Microbacterium sp. CIAB417 TaxID=2860287 RepID=UPI001FAC29AE|nr:cytochrome c oxidase subunit 4 [Microbacterium sp. CIAB417]